MYIFIYIYSIYREREIERERFSIIERVPSCSAEGAEKFVLDGMSKLLSDTLSRSESLILSHHSGVSVACECNEEEINDDDDDLVPQRERG